MRVASLGWLTPRAHAHDAMLTLRTILFPTDDSVLAEAARPLAVRLAERHGARLHILRVDIVTPEMDVWQSAGTQPPPSVHGDGTTEVRRRFPLADVAIAGYADEIGADLIVMATHGRTGIGRLALGSTAEGVLRRASCPVLTVGPEASVELTGPILAPVSFEASTDAALATAAGFADALATKVVALHVVEPIVFPVPYTMTWEPFDVSTLVPHSEATLGRWLAPVTDQGVVAEPMVRQGMAAAEIVGVATEIGASLIVQASHGRRGPSRWLLGSVAETVARRAPCPVLTLRHDTTPIVRTSDSDLLAVPAGQWAELCDALSARARDAPHRVTVVATTPDGAATVLDSAPFDGLTYAERDDALQVFGGATGHAIAHPVVLRATAGPWTADAARDAGATGPWVLEVVRADGTRERIAVEAA